MTGERRLAGETHYFIGPDRAQWRSHIPNFGAVRQQGIYPGIDAVYYGNHRQLEYDLVASPGADVRRIAMRWSGIQRMQVDSHGDLRLDTPRGPVIQKKPIAYQEFSGRRVAVAARYHVLGQGRVGFCLGRYDRSRPLVIDPVLAYSSIIGGDDTSVKPYAIAVDSQGSAYISGNAAGAGLAKRGNGYRNANRDVFVVKVSPDGQSLIYTALLYSDPNGGGEPAAEGIAVDASGSAYVTGWAQEGYPVTPGAFQTRFSGIIGGGGMDAFISKLSPDGSSLIYSTYLGGADEVGHGIALDAQGSAYVVGDVGTANSAGGPSAPFPTTPGAFRTGKRGEAFVAKISPDGSKLAYSTLIGPGTGAAIAVDATGHAYATGRTQDSEFPSMATAPDATAWVVKLETDGSRELYSVVTAGPGSGGLAIAIDAVGNAYVTGRLDGDRLTTTPSVFQLKPGGRNNDCDAFVIKLDPSGLKLLYGTYLGGSDYDEGRGIAVDSQGNAYVTGSTRSTNFPVKNTDFQTTPGGGQCGDHACTDAFVAKISSDGSKLLYSSYLGGKGSDNEGTAIALDSQGNAYLTGFTRNPATFPGGKIITPVAPVDYASGYVVKLIASTGIRLSSPSKGGWNVNLSWIDDGSPNSSYLVERRSGTGAFAQVGKVGTNTTLFADTDLDAGTAFTYRVKSVETGQTSNELTVTTGSVPKGDVNGDGVVNVQDAVLLLRFAVNLDQPIHAHQSAAADVNGDGKVNVQDAILALRIAVGLGP